MKNTYSFFIYFLFWLARKSNHHIFQLEQYNLDTGLSLNSMPQWLLCYYIGTCYIMIIYTKLSYVIQKNRFLIILFKFHLYTTFRYLGFSHYNNLWKTQKVAFRLLRNKCLRGKKFWLQVLQQSSHILYLLKIWIQNQFFIV